MGKRYVPVALGALVIVTVAVVAVVLVGVPGNGEPSAVARPPVATPVTTSTPAPTPTVAPAAAVTPAPTVMSAVSPSPAPTPTASPTPTPEPGGPVLPYNSYDTTGAVTTPGSYAFLTEGDDGATTAVTTYEALRDGTTTALLIHKSDAHGASQAALYDAVEAGDLFEWRMADDCWARYQVTAAPTGTGVTRDVAVRWYSYAYAGCSGAVDLASVDVTFDWDPADIPSSALRSAVRHGDWLAFPVEWDGVLEPEVSMDQPEQRDWRQEGMNHPLYRPATVPAGWTAYGERGHSWGDPKGVPYGYSQAFKDGDGNFAVEIWVSKLTRVPLHLYGLSGYYEARVIDGFAAIVSYATAAELSRFPTLRNQPTVVLIYDPDTGVHVQVDGYHSSLQGGNVDGTIAIALSILNGGQ